MVLSLPNDLRDAFSRQAASLVSCIRITRSDGVVHGLTDHDSTIHFDGTTFAPTDGVSVSQVEHSADLAPDNCELLGAIGLSAFSPSALEAGLYDGAEVEIWRVDWETPSARHLIRVGWIGEVEREGLNFRAEFRSRKAQLGQLIGRVYGRPCDARLGDERCGIDLTQAGYTAKGLVQSVAATTLVVSGIPAVEIDWFKDGRVVVSDGQFQGTSFTIRAQSVTAGQAHLELWDGLVPEGLVGAAVELEVGCDKSFATCAQRFSNTTNFRGFPHIPGNDLLTAYPSSDRGQDG